MFTYISSCALGDIPYHYYFKLQVETINYMNSMENTVNKPKINQNKDRGYFLEMQTRSQVKVETDQTMWYF